MRLSILGKVVHDQWRALAGWTVFSGVLSAFYISLYPSLGGAAAVQQMLDAMRPALRAIFVVEGLDIGTPAGYLNMELFAFIMPLLFIGLTATMGSGATAGKEERGTLDVLLANPLPRWRLVAEKFLGLVLAAAVLAVGVWVALAAGAALAGVRLDLGRVGEGLVSATLLGIVFGALAMALGALTGRRTPSIGAALAIALGGFFINALGPLVKALEPWRVISPMYHYLGNDPLSHGLDPVHALVLAGLAGAGLAVALLAFERRDLST